jgi:toxin ParE1/3/4
MANVTWSPQALKDIENIADYYAKEFPRYGETLTEDMFKKTRLLEQFPKLGRVVPELQIENIRELIHRAYRMMYWLEDDFVEILTVFHSSKEFGGTSGNLEE